ncbi:hypothetical protein ABPG75_003123 [Micractinium tetrahymenae]
MQGQGGELPGEEFLWQRLARAAAVPPEQRSPEVAAFIAAMQLPELVAALMPLTEAGEPALALDSIDTQQRVLLAGLKLELLARTQEAAAELLQLEPDSAWMHRLAGQASRSGNPCAISLDSALVALAALAHAEPALKRLKRLLPVEWLSTLEQMLPAAQVAAQQVQALLQEVQQRGGPRGMRSAAARAQLDAAGRSAKAFEAAYRQALTQDRQAAHIRCDGCGHNAVGLKQCDRCMLARYCSRACQVAHWPQHRAKCKSS